MDIGFILKLSEFVLADSYGEADGVKRSENLFQIVKISRRPKFCRNPVEVEDFSKRLFPG
jgi:hypothetical protein